MNLENTNWIKGIFVWLILFSHKSSYGNCNNYLFCQIILNFGQTIVSIFLFYLGYGIYESIKKKGFNYVKILPTKSFILFIKFQIILLIFLVKNIFILKIKVTLTKYILSICFIEHIGNSNWFSFTIIFNYLYSHPYFRIFKNKYFFGILLLSFFCFLHVLFSFNYFYPKHFYSVDNILCFILG